MRYVDFFAVKRMIFEYPVKDAMIREAELSIIGGQRLDLTGIHAGVGKMTESKAMKLMQDKRLARLKLEKAAVDWAIDYIKTLKRKEEIMRAVELHCWRGHDIFSTAREMNFSESSVKRRLSVMYRAVAAYMGLLQ